TSMVDMAGDGRTIFICSHQIAEVERIASHVAIMADGKLLLAEPLEDLKRRFVKLKYRYDGTAPDPHMFGTVLEREGTPRLTQVVVRDPRREAIDGLHDDPNVHDVTETPLALEEIYATLLARPLQPGERIHQYAEAEPVGAREGGRS